MAARMLRHAGDEVDLAGDGAEAVARYRDAFQAGRPFDAVVLDLTIRGGMGGAEVMEQLRAVDAQVRAILCSGYSVQELWTRYQHLGFRGVLAKPYRMAELIEAVRRVLEDLPSA